VIAPSNGGRSSTRHDWMGSPPERLLNAEPLHARSFHLAYLSGPGVLRIVDFPCVSPPANPGLSGLERRRDARVTPADAGRARQRQAAWTAD
jgi:hypothetical protein